MELEFKLSRYGFIWISWERVILQAKQLKIVSDLSFGVDESRNELLYLF